MKKNFIFEGNFGPGTKKDISIANPNWKASIGAIENKNRPESIYIVMSTWFKPKMSVVSAKQFSEEDFGKLAVEITGHFKKEIDRQAKKITTMFNSEYFDTSSIIFTYDFSELSSKPGKFQFLEIEINIDTINEIDNSGKPAPTRGTGKVNNISFSEFERPLTDAINKILMLDIFSRSPLVDFSKTKKQ